MSPWLKVACVVLVLLGALEGWHLLASHAEAQRRSMRERRYRDTAEYLDTVIKTGTKRNTVEALLDNQALVYSRREWDGDKIEDVITLARESSPAWYCSFEDAQVVIGFAESHTPVKAADSLEFGSPDDAVTSVSLEHQLQDCL